MLVLQHGRRLGGIGDLEHLPRPWFAKQEIEIALAVELADRAVEPEQAPRDRGGLVE